MSLEQPVMSRSRILFGSAVVAAVVVTSICLVVHFRDAALIYSVENNNDLLCFLAVKAGGDPNLINGNCVILANAAYSVLSKEKNLTLVRILLEAGADPNKLGPDGQSAFHTAVYCSPLDRADLLVRYGADVSARTSAGIPPVIFAAMDPGFDKLQYLVDHGADPDSTTPSGETPLFWAIQNNDKAKLLFLLKKGAKSFGHNSSKETGLEVAQRPAYAGMMAVLQGMNILKPQASNEQATKKSDTLE